MKKKLFLWFFLVLIGVLGGIWLSLFSGAEGKHFLFPHIDTHFSKDFKIEKWEKIRIGMSMDTVKQFLGEPLSSSMAKQSPFRPPCATFEMHYSGDGASKFADFAWQSFDIFFDEHNKVVSKSSEWFYD